MSNRDFNAIARHRLGRLNVLIGVGDLVTLRVDAIVCPANSFGTMRGGVAAAIMAAGGESVEQAAIALAPIPIGSSAWTTSGTLPCKWVIHSPTMRHAIERATVANVSRATSSALRVAARLGVQSIAFPGMGTGTGGLGYDKAAHAMIDSLFSLEETANLREVVFVAFQPELAEAWESAFSDARP